MRNRIGYIVLFLLIGVVFGIVFWQSSGDLFVRLAISAYVVILVVLSGYWVVTS